MLYQFAVKYNPALQSSASAAPTIHPEEKTTPGQNVLCDPLPAPSALLRNAGDDDLPSPTSLKAKSFFSSSSSSPSIQTSSSSSAQKGTIILDPSMIMDMIQKNQGEGALSYSEIVEKYLEQQRLAFLEALSSLAQSQQNSVMAEVAENMAQPGSTISPSSTSQRTSL